jgi:hypothetical protein
MSLKKFVVLSVIAILLGGCFETTQPPPKQTTSLQIEAMQTQIFETTKRKAFNAVMTVFQNKGYTILSADLDTGFITAKSATTDTGSGFNISAGFGPLARSATTHYDTTLAATAFISSITQQNKNVAAVRLSFVINKTTSGVGGTYTETTQVLDPEIYKSHFADIRHQIFVAGSIINQ